MEMARERISLTVDPRDVLLSLQNGFNFVRAAVACAILERIIGLEPSSETTAPRYSKLVTVPSFCPLPSSPSGCHWRCSSLVWSSQHWSPSCTLWKLCLDFQLGFLVSALCQIEHLCHRQTADLSSMLTFPSRLQERQTWSVREKCWREWVTEDILSLLRLLFWTILPCWVTEDILSLLRLLFWLLIQSR